MPFGFWVLGNAMRNQQTEMIEALSQMPFGFWVLGNRKAQALAQYVDTHGLKCLSAFGFWGTSGWKMETKIRR